MLSIEFRKLLEALSHAGAELIIVGGRVQQRLSGHAEPTRVARGLLPAWDFAPLLRSV